MQPVIVNQRYKRIELLGAGGMATVYRGEDIKLNRPVAMKFLREPYASDLEARQRFLDEARNAAQLDHNAVVRIYDVGEDRDNRNRPFIVMELVEGEHLKALIRREGPLGVAKALSLTRQICHGVGQAHNAGIVHCDLKPQNIIVTPDGKAKVTDFGIARALKQEEELANANAAPADVVWGSPHYLSPEQGRGETLTPASDVYSIGVMLYEMLTGVPPFHDDDPTALVLKHLREEPQPMATFNPRVPPGLEGLVRKVLSKEPSARFRNAEQFAVAIEQYMQRGEDYTGPLKAANTHTPPPATVVTPPRQTPARPRPAPPSRPDVQQSAIPIRQPDTRPNRNIHSRQPALGQYAGSSQNAKPQTWKDSILWTLIGIAAIAVIGLIPLWLVVYQAWTVDTPVVTPGTGTVATPTQNASIDQITVPNLKGLNATDARSLAEDQGFSVQMLGEIVTDEYRPGAVIDQEPNAGSRVAKGSTLGIRVAIGREITMAAVETYELKTVRGGLESEGLELVILEERSHEVAGYILKQDPDAGSTVRVGQTITLTVSGGLDMPIELNVNLNNQVVLEQAQVGQNEFFTGDSVPVTLRWRCIGAFDHQYKVFVHLLTLDHNTAIGQNDSEPVNGLRPTTGWQVGEVINDPHQVLLNFDVLPGTYEIRVGMYDDNGRLPVVDPAEADIYADTIFIDTFTVKGQ